MKRIVLLCIALLFFAVQFASAEECKVVGVTDGDTIKALCSGKMIKVRLYGIDSPEKSQPFGQKARETLASMVAGAIIDIRPTATDRYGRTVAWIYKDGTNINEGMVRSGMAWHYKNYSSDANLADAERQARAGKAGLWSDRNPVAPWDYRRGKRDQQTTKAENAGQYHGNVKSLKFHAPHCKDYNCKNCTMVFNSRKEAIAAGYKPCGICKP